MPPTRASPTLTLTLDQVIARLARHDAVDGVIVMGSASDNTLKPASDYDLWVVLSALPAPLWLVFTWVDHRLTEVLFTSVPNLERLVADGAIAPANSHAATELDWLRHGRIAFDRVGRLRRARERARATGQVGPVRERDSYATWFKINYNVQQTRRMLGADDPLYHLAVDFRLLYSLAELWTGYFVVRRLPWLGEKAALRYLSVHDPDYLALFRRCLGETDRARKVGLYAELATATLAPLGGLWASDATAVTVELPDDEELPPEMVPAALAFWEQLVGEPSEERTPAR